MKDKCPVAYPDDPALQAAFQRMYDTETALDDMDYLTDSPKLQAATEAAISFRKMLEAYEVAGLGRGRKQ